MILDVVGIVTGFSYVILLVAALLTAGSAQSTTMRRLRTAIRLYWVAIAAESAKLVTDIADVPSDGVLWPLISAFCLGSAVMCLVSTRRRLMLKGEQVTAEAERTVRNWSGGAL